MKKLLNKRFLGILLIIEALLMFVPTIVLGFSINWPQILGEPAEVVLPLIYQNNTATLIGYFGYLIYSILFFPAIALTAYRFSEDGNNNPILSIAIVFSGLSALARSIGIIRWLSVMPFLANMYQQGVANKEVIEVVFHSINSFGGAIGEILGVSLFASFSLGLLNYYSIKQKSVPSWIAALGLASAFAILIPSLELFGVDVGIINIVSVSVLQLWFLIIGAYFILLKDRI